MSQTWILVADGARARLFARAADGALTEIACHTNPDGSAPQRHLGALPRTQESHGSARHAIEPHTDEHDKSQQRFARRRGNQADALVEAVQDHLVRILDGQPAPAALVVGGDKTLAADVLRDPRLRHLTALPARTAYAIADPKRAVLDDTLRRARNVHVTIHELT